MVRRQIGGGLRQHRGAHRDRRGRPRPRRGLPARTGLSAVLCARRARRAGGAGTAAHRRGPHSDRTAQPDHGPGAQGPLLRQERDRHEPLRARASSGLRGLFRRPGVRSCRFDGPATREWEAETRPDLGLRPGPRRVMRSRTPEPAVVHDRTCRPPRPERARGARPRSRPRVSHPSRRRRRRRRARP